MVGRREVSRLSAGDLGGRPSRRSQDARRRRPASRPPHGAHPARRLCRASSPSLSSLTGTTPDAKEKTWCPSGHDCVPPLSSYRAAVASQLSHLPPDTPVLVTTDDTSREFLSSIQALGWLVVDHVTLGTEALLIERYGEKEYGWYGSAVDQAIHSLGTGFVGTEDSQVSLVAALRVAAWSGGRSEMVKRPK